MKKNLSKFCLLGIVISLGFVSCKKKEILDSNQTKSMESVRLEVDNSKFHKGTEISFVPESKDAIFALTKRFVSQTNYKVDAMKTTIYDMEDPDVNAGAWLFEAASNYLENSNSVESEDEEVNFSIVIDKLNTGELRGTDLVAKFNAFIANLESYRATEGYKPKVIDIRIGIDNSEVLELLANVTIGVSGIGQYAFPTNNVDPKDAAQIYLTGSVTQASRLLNTTYMQVANPNGSQTPTGIFLSGVVSNNVNITQDLTGNNFYFGLTSSPYLATFFQQEHDAIYNKVLNYCGQQNIPSTKLWSISVNYDITVQTNSYIRHKVTSIKTADVNVM